MRVTVVLLALLLLFAPPAAANMSAPWRSGDPAGEPLGEGLGEFHIVREDLHLDLRPLADGDQIRIKAVYHLENRGPGRDLDLVFLGQGLSGAQVRSDGQLIRAGEVELPQLPASWAPPRTTPALGEGERPVEFRDRSVKGLAFRVHLEPGPHRLEVGYRTAPPTYHPTSRIYREHQVVYLLAPARAWGSFGELHVQVDLPPGFAWKSSLPLQDRGSSLDGRFTGLPADHLAITTSLEGEDWSGPAALGIAIVAVLLGGVAAWFWARSVQERGTAMRLLAGCGAAFLGSLLGGGGFLAGDGAASLGLDASQISSAWSYGLVFQALAGAVVAAIAGAGAAAVAFLVASLRRRPKPS